MARTKITSAQLYPIAFKAYRSATFNSPNGGSSTNFAFDTSVYNYGSAYSTSTGNFTAPVNGIYEFKVQFNTETGNMSRAFIIPRYGVGISTTQNATRLTDMSNSSPDGVSRISAILELYLTAGQTVGFDLYTSASFNVASADTWCTGRLVYAV